VNQYCILKDQDYSELYKEIFISYSA